MANIASLLKRIESGVISDEEKLNVLSQVEQSLQDMRQKKQEAIQSNVMLIVDALKQMQVKVEQQLEEAKAIVPQKGQKGDRGEKGDRGLDGSPGKDGRDGINGKDGKDGKDGISVTDAKIDFDGSLVITLSNGREINVGEVLPLDVSDKIKVIANGGGTSQTVVDTLTSLQNQINTLTGVDGVLGDMAQQNANNVAITGGAINGATIGGVTPAAGTFTTLTATGQTSLGGAAGSEGLRVLSVASTVNWIQARGHITGNTPSIRSNGETNIGLGISSNGTGSINFYSNSLSNEQFRVSHTASAVNYVQVTGSATGGAPTISTQGSDANAGLVVQSKGTSPLYLVTLGATDVRIQPNSLRALSVNSVNSAVNYFSMTNSASTFAPSIAVQGSDTNIDLTLTPKGTGQVRATNATNMLVVSNGQNGYGSFLAQSSTGAAYLFGYSGGSEVGRIYFSSGSTGIATGSPSTTQFVVANTASAVNYVQVTGSATGSGVTVSAQGSDTNVALNLASKAAQNINFRTGASSLAQFTVVHNGATIVNQATATGSATGVAPVFGVQGSDTNIDLALTPKGTGYVQFGTYTGTALTIAGYIEIKDSGGTVRKLAVVA